VRLSQRSREDRANRKKMRQRAALGTLANRCYDEHVALSDGSFDARQRARSITKRIIERAYVDGSRSHKEFIEEFRGGR
jgi:hypothetical protein